MGLKAVRGRLPKREKAPDLTIDLSAFTGTEGDALRFRQPVVADYISLSGRTLDLRKKRPRTKGDTAVLCLLLAACYQKDGPEDAGAGPEDFADIADETPDVFLHIAGRFSEAFPMSLKTEAAAPDEGEDEDDAKNG